MREPQPRNERPRCPSVLRPDARGDWRRLSRLLWEMGVLRQTHRETLARYCELLARRRKLAAFILKFEHSGECMARLAVDSKTKKEKIVGFDEIPQSRIHDRIAVELRRLEQELGLTPASQTRLETDISEEGRYRRPSDATDVSGHIRIA